MADVEPEEACARVVRDDSRRYEEGFAAWMAVKPFAAIVDAQEKGKA